MYVSFQYYWGALNIHLSPPVFYTVDALKGRGL